MKPIIKIAKNELRNLFYSPVAWFLAIVFMVMCAFFYTSLMYPQAKGFFMILKLDPNWIYRASESATATIFSNIQGGFFPTVLSNLYLFVPLLTMSIISREFNSGTIRLLYSSPVRLRQIVLGKYLALMIYTFIFVVIMGIFVVTAFFDIKSLDYGPLLCALLGIYLFLCALTSIGFFMSSLTSYQIVAAIASFTVLFVLMVIGGLWQEYDFVRDLTYFLSIRNRTEWMIRGLIRSKDIIYYLLIIAMFVGFTLLKLRAGRESKPWYIKVGRYAAIAVSGLLIGYISASPRLTGYIDTTRRKVNTLHPRSQKILQELGDSTLQVTLYTNLFDWNGGNAIGFPSARNIYLDMWEPYVRFKPNIQFKYEYYYDAMPGDSLYYKTFPNKSLQQIAGLQARGMQVDSALFKSPEEMHRLIDLSPENYPTIMQLRYRGRTTFLRYTPGETGIDFEMFSAEPNINAALKRVLGARIPKIAFISGELERNIYKKGERECWNHTIGKGALNDPVTKGSLINLGFDADTLNLATQDISSDITTIVLADPKMDISPMVLSKLKRYVSGGGNLLVFGEPGKQYVLNPFLQQLGIQLTNGQLVQRNVNETPDKVTSYYTPAYLDLAEEHWSLLGKYLLVHGVKDGIGGISTPTVFHGATGVASEKDSGFTAKVLYATTPGYTWLKTGRLVTDSIAPVFSPDQGDVKKDSFPIAVQLSRQLKSKEQRIIVLGDADITSNLRGIGDAVRSFYSWLNDRHFPVHTPFTYAKDNIIVLKPGWASGQKILYLWILPAIMLAMATVLLVRRNRK